MMISFRFISSFHKLPSIEHAPYDRTIWNEQKQWKDETVRYETKAYRHIVSQCYSTRRGPEQHST